MSDNVIEDKSLLFALKVIEIYKVLVYKKKEYVLSKQLLRSGTAIGAMVRESKYAQSKSDFIHKLSIGIKECNETLYWLQLLNKSEYLNDEDYYKIEKLGIENLKILPSIIVTSKKSIQ